MTRASDNTKMLAFMLAEYDKLKDEQHKRIAFRDQMIYLTLAAIGAVFSFALEKPQLNTALLVLPFVCMAMGWTYSANDLKISQIGQYIRTVLIPKFENESGDSTHTHQNWETFVRGDKHRRKRKRIQLLVDLGIFIFPAVASLVSFLLLHPNPETLHYGAAAIEVIGLVFLAIKFIKFADIR